MQFHRSLHSMFLKRPPPSFILLIVIAICMADGIKADHVWEDFPGAEMKGLKFHLIVRVLHFFIKGLKSLTVTLYIFREISLLFSDILSDIGKKTLEVEKSESQAYKGEEETNYELLPLVPKSEAQKQYLPTLSENEYEVTIMNFLFKFSLVFS